MDSHNLFFTRTTSRLLRLECLAALGVSAVLAVLHISEIRWPVFIGLFLIIDLIGYIPGHVVWRLRDGSVPRTFAAGTMRISADVRSGCRNANCTAESAPAEPPATGSFLICSVSSNSTKASA